jgi:hypothetical protein
MQSIFTFKLSWHQLSLFNVINIKQIMAEINQIFLRMLWWSDRRLHLAASEAFEGEGEVENMGRGNKKLDIAD